MVRNERSLVSGTTWGGIPGGRLGGRSSAKNFSACGREVSVRAGETGVWMNRGIGIISNSVTGSGGAEFSRRMRRTRKRHTPLAECNSNKSASIASPTTRGLRLAGPYVRHFELRHRLHPAAA